MEIGRAAGQSSQNGPLQPPNILPKSGDQGASWIRGCLDFVRGPVLQSYDREIVHIEWSAHIADADVQWRGHGMVAGVGRVVTRAAGAWDRGQIQIIVESSHAGDGYRLGIE